MKKLSILAFAMGLIAFTACSEKKAPAQAPAQAEQTVVTDSAFQAAQPVNIRAQMVSAVLL